MSICCGPLFFKTYKAENDLAATLGSLDENFLRKMVKITVEFVALLESVAVSDILLEKIIVLTHR